MIHLLMNAGSQVFVPEPVAEEILRRGTNDITAKALETTQWLKIIQVPVIPGIIQSWDLGPGESAVLAYAYENTGVKAIIDDAQGRYCAETLGLPVIGTLGLVMIARKRGDIQAARPIVTLLKQHGMYLSESVIEEAMMLIDE